jgi:uncharacterized protein YceK
VKKIIIGLAVFFLVGCVTVKVPKYLQEDFPYRKDFTADFDRSFEATYSALKELGWSIAETTSPSAFDPAKAVSKRQLLIFTEIRQTPLFLSSAYASLNAYLREIDKDHTQIEIRYLSVLPLPFKNVNSYQNDSLIQKIFARIEKNLKK